MVSGAIFTLNCSTTFSIYYRNQLAESYISYLTFQNFDCICFIGGGPWVDLDDILKRIMITFAIFVNMVLKKWSFSLHLIWRIIPLFSFPLPSFYLIKIRNEECDSLSPPCLLFCKYRSLFLEFNSVWVSETSISGVIHLGKKLRKKEMMKRIFRYGIVRNVYAMH